MTCIAPTTTNGARNLRPAADVFLETFFQEHLEAVFALSPVRASKLGDHRYDHRLDEISATALNRRRELLHRALDSLPQRVEHAELSRDGQIDYAMLHDALRFELWLLETERPWETDPRLATQLATDGVYVLLTQSTLPAAQNIRNAIARIRQVPDMLRSARMLLRDTPRVRTEVAIQQNRGAIAFYENDLFELIGDTPQHSEARMAAQAATEALREHQRFLEDELLPLSTEHWRAGSAHFEQKAAFLLETELSATELLAEAETAFEHAQQEMHAVAAQLWSHAFPDQPLPPDDTAGRRETIERVVDWVSRDHGQPETLCNEVLATVDELRTFIRSRKLVRLPEPDTCRIIEMPEFQRGNSVAFLDPAPPLDPAAASIYAISPPPQEWPAARVESYLREYNRPMLKMLTVHEAYPGHYVQLGRANTHPSLLRRVLGSEVFAEGWANYCEQMMLEEGFGGGDLALRLMQLKYSLRTLANAILDHRMHCTAMTDEEALDLLIRQSFQTEGEAQLKIVRAKLGCGQLSTYFAGRRALLHVRAVIKKEFGVAFDLGRFHEAVLSHGSMPVKRLLECVRDSLQFPPA